eukprot:TRINITY_DN9175_c0_g1_i1.p1 TRINITY_DN9175_c0_g1~~TRINITY_DN9175_c0_g1_i1.p1  ORF type:complete len:325 (+),score=44.05 TRINITY_DN9175_c0_g1_i1:274-1248(+)
MQGGLHCCFGLLLCLLVRNGDMKVGIVLGSILPDLDLLVTVAAIVIHEVFGSFFLTELFHTHDIVDAVHRTATHSLLFTFILSGLCMVMPGSSTKTESSVSPSTPPSTPPSSGRTRSRKSAALTNDRTIEDTVCAVKRREDGVLSRMRSDKNYVVYIIRRIWSDKFDGLYLGIGLAVGLIGHILFDMCYLKGVAIMYPFDTTLYQFEDIGTGDFRDLDPNLLNLIMASDFLTEVVFFYVPMIAFSYYCLARRSVELQRTLSFFTRLSIIQSAVILAICVVPFFVTVHLDLFMTLLFIPGTPLVVMINLAPLAFRESIRQIPTIY